jgi:hypothetical protein
MLLANRLQNRKELGPITSNARKNAEAEVNSLVYGTAIQALQNMDLGQAHAFFMEHKDKLGAQIIQEFESRFAQALPTWNGVKQGDEIYSKHGRLGYGDALKELWEAGGTPAEKEIARDRITQRFQKDTQAKRIRDDQALEGFYRISANMTPDEQLNQLAGLGLEPDLYRSAVGTVQKMISGISEREMEIRFYDAYVEYLVTPDKFALRNLVEDLPYLGVEKFEKLQRLQENLEDRAPDPCGRAIATGIKLWDSARGNKLPTNPSESDVASYKLRRDAAMRFLTSGIEQLSEAGLINDSRRVSHVQISALGVQEQASMTLGAASLSPSRGPREPHSNLLASGRGLGIWTRGPTCSLPKAPRRSPSSGATTPTCSPGVSRDPTLDARCRSVRGSGPRSLPDLGHS